MGNFKDFKYFRKQWITNFIVQPNYYGSYDTKIGYDRYEKIYEELSGTDGIVSDEWAAMELLGKLGRRSNFRYENVITLYSVVYNLTDKSILYVSNEHYDDETAVFEYKLD